MPIPLIFARLSPDIGRHRQSDASLQADTLICLPQEASASAGMVFLSLRYMNR